MPSSDRDGVKTEEPPAEQETAATDDIEVLLQGKDDLIEQFKVILQDQVLVV